ncbi:hypothetical protein B296_00021653 [Ensete ventricosum]|uniref:Uncharacterized protein n=1 Tax=Ensete ventricosum TaxID=4639 RepID=A0A426X748_ENSVE|nr:hypothetical protein B296_00021653 [Ensete ventricosum]
MIRATGELDYSSAYIRLKKLNKSEDKAKRTLLPIKPIVDAPVARSHRRTPVAALINCRPYLFLGRYSTRAQPPLPSLLPHLPSLLLPCFLLPLLIAATFLFNHSLTCHVVASLSPVVALTTANRLCPPLADADNLVAVKSYYIYDICL